MMKKQPKRTFSSSIKKVIGIAVLAEFVAVVGSYLVYHKLNTDRDFRYYVKENYSPILEGYYKLGEYADSTNAMRKVDEKLWNTTKEAH